MLWNRRVYLDTAAGAVGNPSSPHAEGRAAKQMLEYARVSIARLLEVQADDVLFTSGATESNALAILGHARALRARAGKDAVGRNNMHVLYLPSAHASIVENVKTLGEEGITIEPLPIKNWRVDTEALEKLLRPETVLIAMEAVCGETGVAWNTREVAQVVEAHNRANTFRAPSGLVRTSQPVASKSVCSVVLLVDASQAVQSEKLTRAHFGADLLTLDGAKLGVPGIGVLVAHRTIPLHSLYRGGGQERGVRPGSEHSSAAAQLATALGVAASQRAAFCAQAELDRVCLIETLCKTIPLCVVNEGRTRVPHILNLSFLGRETDYLVALLDEAGFAVSTKSACETNSMTGSRAVMALTGDTERACSTVRISWGTHTSSRDMKRFATACIRAVQFIDTHASG